MDDIQARAARGELTGAQARQEIHALRERLAVNAGIVMQWAVQPQGVALLGLLATSLQASGIAPRVADTFAPLLS